MSAVMRIGVDSMSSSFFFRIRTPLAFGAAMVLCAVVAAPLSLAIPWLIADLAGVAAGVIAYHFVFSRVAFTFPCKGCMEIISTDTPWTCGFCRQGNSRTDEFPFVYQCQHCGAQPKAYRCHHKNCGTLIFLTGDRLEANFACCLNTLTEATEVPRKTQREEEAMEAKHQLLMADLKEKLEALAKRRQPPLLKSKWEQKTEMMNDEFQATMAVEKHAAELRKKVAEDYKDDPERLEKANMMIDEMVARHSQ